MSHFALFPFSCLRCAITGCLELSHVTKDMCGSNICARAVLRAVLSSKNPKGVWIFLGPRKPPEVGPVARQACLKWISFWEGTPIHHLYNSRVELQFELRWCTCYTSILSICFPKFHPQHISHPFSAFFPQKLLISPRCRLPDLSRNNAPHDCRILLPGFLMLYKFRKINYDYVQPH